MLFNPLIEDTFSNLKIVRYFTSTSILLPPSKGLEDFAVLDGHYLL